MKIKEITLKMFKRFTDLRVMNIPETAKLIVLVGPNGSGKTSLFEALNHWYRLRGFNNTGDKDYFEKKSDLNTGNRWYQDKVEVLFHGEVQPIGDQVKGKLYFRSAYRNDPDFTASGLSRVTDPTQSPKLSTLMQNDKTVSENYQRLVSQTLSKVYDDTNNEKSVQELRNELIGKVKSAVLAVFDDLSLNSIGDPMSNGSFYFKKGTSSDFHYKNLSAGEKSVFDILLDLIVKSDYYPDAVYCIDEPEAHMHTRLQSKFLRGVFSLIPQESQLWISTHSIGMLKEAEQIENDNPGSVVFLDFANRDFDSAETMEPSIISRTIWNRFFDLALGDFSALIAPRQIVFCEGTSKGRVYKNFDAQIYAKIFGEKYHDTVFVSIGSCTEIEDIENQSVRMLSNILKSSKLIKFVDRDDKSTEEIRELNTKQITVSCRRHIESYLLDNEIIAKLCNSTGHPELLQSCIIAKETAIQNSILRDNPTDDIKSASGEIYTEVKRILSLSQCGNNKCAFLRDTLAPLITEETNIYKLLESELFGDD